MKRLGTALALIGMSAPEAAMAQQRACITAPEAEAMTLVAMPDILRETGRVCAARLPANSLIRGNGTLIAKYETAADRAGRRRERRSSSCPTQRSIRCCSPTLPGRS